MRLVVHIGSHKTGSTSIQDYCVLNQDYLLSHGICYPTGFFPKYPRQHSELRELLIQDRMEAVREFFDQAIAMARTHSAETVFLSGEDMSALGPGLAHRFQATALKYFDQTQIVLVLRNKKEFFYSLYKHNLFYGPPTDEVDFSERQRFSPRACTEAWRDIKDLSMRIISFEVIKHALLKNFFREVFGLTVSDNIFSNQSLDYLTLQIMNSFLKGQGKDIERILVGVNQQHPIEFSLPIEDVVARNIDRQHPDDEWEIYGIKPEDAILQKRVIRSDRVDHIKLCRKMIDLFTALEKHFSRAE